MPIPTPTSPAHGANVVAIKHMLHRIYTQETIVVWTVVTVKIVICIFKLQESHVLFLTGPTNRGALDWIVQSIEPVSTLLDKLVGLRIKSTLALASTAGLEVALQVRVAKVLPFVIWEQVNGFMCMKQTEGSFVSHQIALSNYAVTFVLQHALTHPVGLGCTVHVSQGWTFAFLPFHKDARAAAEFVGSSPAAALCEFLLHVVHKVVGRGAVVKAPIIVRTIVAKTDAKMFVVAEVPKIFRSLDSADIGELAAALFAGAVSLVVRELLQPREAWTIVCHAIADGAVIGGGRWGELFAVAQLVASHVVEVPIGIIRIVKLLMPLDRQQTCLCEVKVKCDACILFAPTVFILCRQGHRVCNYSRVIWLR